MIYTRLARLLFVGCALLASARWAAAAEISLESWRMEDRALWEGVVLREFSSSNPDITVRFNPTVATEYDKAVELRLAARRAGDLITCRPFDASYKLYRKGYLQKLNGIPGLGTFRSMARQAWTTDDGLALFCMPVASVMHGFFYNKTMLDRMGLAVPDTQDQFFALLEALKKDPAVVPLAFGTKDEWQSAQVVFNGIGPNFWEGEKGRLALLDGSAKFSDAPYVKTWAAMARWAPYMPSDFAQLDGDQVRTLFTSGKAAIYPAGSWEIAQLTRDSKFEIGVFKPPVQKPGDACFVANHIDMGIGINSASPNKDDAETFLNWVSSKQFAQIFASGLPGYFPLASHPVEFQEPLSREMSRWRRSCQNTIRVNSYVFNRGSPPMEQQLWRVSAAVMNGKLSPQEAGRQIQSSLDRWFKPLQ